MNDLLCITANRQVRIVCNHYYLTSDFCLLDNLHKKCEYSFIVEILLWLIEYNRKIAILNEQIENQQQSASLTW